jgi:hypothetical protein
VPCKSLLTGLGGFANWRMLITSLWEGRNPSGSFKDFLFAAGGWRLDRDFKCGQVRIFCGQKNDPIGAAQAMLTFLRSSPDWDTVKRLRVNPLTQRDAVELARELIAMESAM